MLVPTSSIRIGNLEYSIRCTLRSIYRFEARLGIGLHQMAGHDTARVARCLLWSMAVEAGWDVTEDLIGRARPGEFVAAVDQALMLVAASCPPAQRSDQGQREQPPTADRTNWSELWAIGRYDLRLTEDELWGMTPAMFHALCLRLDAAREHAEYCAGLVASTVANCHIDPDKTEPFEPGLWTRRGAAEAQRQRSANEAAALSAKLKSLSDFLPGLKVIKAQG